MLKVGKWYKRKKDGKNLYCYELSCTGASFAYFSKYKGGLCKDVMYPSECTFIEKDLYDLLNGHNKSSLSTALGKHRSYLNKLIQLGCSEELYNEIKAKITIDWSSDKPLYVNDHKHVPFTIKPINCTLPKHKEWLQELMMKGCIKL